MINENNLSISDECLDWLIKVLNREIRNEYEYGENGNEQLHDNVIELIYRYFNNVDCEFDDLEEADWRFIEDHLFDLYEESKYAICRDLIVDLQYYSILSIEHFIEDRTSLPYYSIKLDLIGEEGYDDIKNYEIRVYELWKDNGEWVLELDTEGSDACVELWRSDCEVGYFESEDEVE